MGQAQQAQQKPEAKLSEIEEMISDKRSQLDRLKRELELVNAELAIRRKAIDVVRHEHAELKQRKEMVWSKLKGVSESLREEEELLQEFRDSLEEKKRQAQQDVNQFRLQLQKDFEQYKTKILHKKNQLLESIVKLQKEQPPPYNAS